MTDENTVANRFSFEDVEKEVRTKTFGIIGVVDSKNRPHTTGILFGMSVRRDPLYFYIVASKRAAKIRYISRNPNVSLLVTFPHYWLRFIPDSTVLFRGTADIVTIDDVGFIRAFQQKRMLRMNLDASPVALSDLAVIRIRPKRTVYCYGLGIGINELRKNPTGADYKVRIPKSRLQTPADHRSSGDNE